MKPGKNNSTRFSRRQFIGMLTVTGLSACTPYIHSPSRYTDIHFLDVGYGDAVLVRRNGIAVMIDGGYSVWTSCLLNEFLRLDIDRLAAVIVTHPHPDHIGGVYGVLASGFPVDKVYGAFPLSHHEMPSGFRKLFESGSLTYTQCRRNDMIHAGNSLDFSVLHPDIIVSDMNDSSLVVTLETAAGSVLFGADIGPAAQHELTQLYGERLKSCVLKCPHHGGSSDPEFIRMVQPELVYVSVGINPYGNPAEETLKRYRDTGARILRSDRDGSLAIRLDDRGKITFQRLNVPCGTR
jgi:competence protein ComEC